MYKVFTCPLFGCQNQNKAIRVEHSSYNNESISYIEWGYFENAYNCKITHGASPLLNGRLTAEVEVKGASAYVYLMPNNFKGDTIGIFENNIVTAKLDSGTYQVPSDWTIYVTYNVGYLDGFVRVKSWAKEYTPEDILFVESWRPTGTYYISPEEKARLAAE